MPIGEFIIKIYLKAVLELENASIRCNAYYDFKSNFTANAGATNRYSPKF